jgi:hypothetical protein
MVLVSKSGRHAHGAATGWRGERLQPFGSGDRTIVQPRMGGASPARSGRIEPRKKIRARISCNLLKKLNSDERIQGNPSFSKLGFPGVFVGEDARSPPFKGIQMSARAVAEAIP